MPGFRFDLSANAFVEAGGAIVPERAVRAALDSVIDASAARMRAAAGRLQSGRLMLADFQLAMMAEVKQAHVTASLAAHGGRQNMAPADWLWVARDVKAQYRYLSNWSRQIRDGTAPLDGRMVSRAELYALSATSTYEAMKLRDAEHSGATVEVRNVLAAGADHCTQCPTLTAAGWVKLSSMVPVGQRRCRVRDRCRLAYRTVGGAPT